MINSFRITVVSIVVVDYSKDLKEKFFEDLFQPYNLSL